MWIILTCVLVLKIFQVNGQFPDHIDLEKVGSVTFNNEKYNVLRPTVHKITDYFAEKMLRENNQNENKISQNAYTRIFIDDNGFRHYWSGLKNKNIIRQGGNDEEASSEVNNQHKDEPNEQENVESEKASLGENPEWHTDDIPNQTENTDPDIMSLTEDPEVNSENIPNETEKSDSDMPIITENATTNKPISLTKQLLTLEPLRVATKKPPPKNPATKKPPPNPTTKKPPPKPTTKIPTPQATTKKPHDKQKLNDESKVERTIAKTTFFCPFIGIIQMKSYIDNHKRR